MNSPAPSSAELAAFQTALLEVLHAGGDPAVMRASLLSRVSSDEMAAYVNQFEERMLVVASELVQKWARR